MWVILLAAILLMTRGYALLTAIGLVFRVRRRNRILRRAALEAQLEDIHARWESENVTDVGRQSHKGEVIDLRPIGRGRKRRWA